jgi:selenocysteine lyase/cysteine desulfurase
LQNPSSLETYFEKFREGVVGIDTFFQSPIGRQRIVYTDWTASGRLYEPIERRLRQDFGQYVANTHTETNVTGSLMTHAYHDAKLIIKAHINANNDDVLLMVGSGMTGAVNKWLRILGLRVPEKWRNLIKIADEDRPVVFITHMEHHSNQTTWLETIAIVEIIQPNEECLVCLESLQILLEKHKNRAVKIAAITACSNITGIQTPYHAIAAAMHQAGGVCFVDFACSAPYMPIDMHPENPDERLDAIYFSPHKFLGGPGAAGVLVFNKSFYKLKTPDHPGGGTVKWTNPWGGHSYLDDIESREDGGTPPFMQTIQTALCIRLKEKMGVENIIAREHELVNSFLPELKAIAGVNVLAEAHADRLPIFSFYITDLHYNLGVRLLNDYFGIQVRGGCSCAGTYGHYLLNVDKAFSDSITCQIDVGDLSSKPGWIRLSMHPTTTLKELEYCLYAIRQLAANFGTLGKDYLYNKFTNDFELTTSTDNFAKQKAIELLKL